MKKYAAVTLILTAFGLILNLSPSVAIAYQGEGAFTCVVTSVQNPGGLQLSVGQQFLFRAVLLNEGNLSSGARITFDPARSFETDSGNYDSHEFDFLIDHGQSAYGEFIAVDFYGVQGPSTISYYKGPDYNRSRAAEFSCVTRSPAAP